MNDPTSLTRLLDNANPPATTETVKREIPESIRTQLIDAGKRRAQRITHEERVENGRKSWQTRLERARESGQTKTTKEPNASKPKPITKAA